MPLTCGLPPHPSSMNYNPHMPSCRAFPWEQLKRKKISRTIDLSHGKFWTFLFAQLFHCNLTSLTCNLPLPNTTNHTPPSRHKKSNRKKTSRTVKHSCGEFLTFLCAHLFNWNYLPLTYHLPTPPNHELQSPLPTTLLSWHQFNRFCVMM